MRPRIFLVFGEGTARIGSPQSLVRDLLTFWDRPYLMARTTLSTLLRAMVELNLIWGKATIGLALTEAYCDDEYVTVDSVAADLKMNDDTARRALDQLVREKKAMLDIISGRRRYRATRHFAELTIAAVGPMLTKRPQVAVKRG